MVINLMCTCLVIYVDSTPVMWSSKRQGLVASSSYAAQFSADRQACEQAVAIHYMLLALAAALKGAQYVMETIRVCSLVAPSRL